MKAIAVRAKTFLWDDPCVEIRKDNGNFDGDGTLALLPPETPIHVVMDVAQACGAISLDILLNVGVVDGGAVYTDPADIRGFFEDQELYESIKWEGV